MELSSWAGWVQLNYLLQQLKIFQLVIPEYLQSSHTETCEGTEHIQELSGAQMYRLHEERGNGNNLD